jgi:aminocarboxymuconate-semialdehyde decarboxylase
MKIDVWTHVLSPAYVRQIEEAGKTAPGLAAFLLGNRGLHDMDFRFEVMDQIGDYRQILTPIPGAHVHIPLAGGVTFADAVRGNNEGMADLVGRYPDRFAGYVAATALSDPDVANEEAIRAVRELGALGVQLEEDATNLPLHEERYDPLFAAMEELGTGVWLHPFRNPATPGIPPESVPFALWQAFTWVFDTTITVARLIFSGIYDRHPELKLIAHHGGALIPHFSGRIELLPALSTMDRGLEDALAKLQRPLIDYFKMLYVDTALFGASHAVECVIDFFGPDHVLFGTDTPFDGAGGAKFIPATISDIEKAVTDADAQAAIFEGNAHRLLRIQG